MSGETILIVDDSREIVAALADVLHLRGYDTLIAHDGRQGLQLALDKEPDLILLDWNLPQLSGYQVLVALRDQGSKAPVVLMTVYGSESVAVQAFRLGIRDYIPKPFRVPDTMATIERALAEDRLRREKEQISHKLEQLNRQMEQQLLELTTLQALGQSLTSTLDLEAVLKRVVEAAGYFTDARESTLFLLDQEADQLALRAYHGLERSRPADLRLPLSSSPLAEAVETGEPLNLSTAASDYSIKLHTGFVVRSLLFVPLQIQQAPLGVLGVTDKVSGQGFTADDARLLTSLSTYAAIAIENARLNESQKEVARAETVKQMIVTLSHYIKNPLTAISLSTYDLGNKHDQRQLTGDTESLKRNLQMIEMNVKEITAVLAILQDLAAPKSTTYVNGIKMIDIEEQVQERVRRIREEYPELDALLSMTS